MAYTDGKAVGRRTPGESAGDSPAPAPAVVSNQALTQGQTAKFRSYALNTSASNQVRFDTAGKGLNVAGRPSTMSLDAKDKMYAAVENPSK